MRTTTLSLGMLQTNCYIVEDDQSRALIVDPGAKAEKVIAFLEKEHITPVAIVLTHGHFDHIGAVDALYQQYHIPIYMHHDDYELVSQPSKQSRATHRIHISSPITFVKEGKQTLHGFEVEFIHAPGHTEGCMMMIYKGQLFSGDVLFLEDIGRTDLDTSNPSKMKQTLRIIATLDPDLVVYPGHEESTTLKHELQHNPYLTH